LTHISYQVGFLFIRQFELQHEIEEFNRIFEGQQTAIMQIRGAILDASQRESLYWPVSWLVYEAFEFQVVHLLIKKRGRLMTAHALALPEKNFFTAQFMCGRFGRIEPALGIEFWRGGEIQHILKLCHMTHVNSIEYRKTLFHRMDRVSIEVGGTEFELGEVFH
jgi:hypothetical protein